MAKNKIIELEEEVAGQLREWRIRITDKQVFIECPVPVDPGNWLLRFKIEINKRENWEGNRPYMMTIYKYGQKQSRKFYASKASVRCVVRKHGGPHFSDDVFDVIDAHLLAKEMIKSGG